MYSKSYVFEVLSNLIAVSLNDFLYTQSLKHFINQLIANSCDENVSSLDENVSSLDENSDISVITLIEHD